MSELQERALTLEEIRQQYRVNYAGHPRYNRQRGPLLGLISGLEELIGELDKTEEDGDSMRETVTQLLQRYRSELGEIDTAQAEPLAVQRLWALRERLSLHRARYLRNFSGYPRNTRDGQLLVELSMDLALWSDEFRQSRDEEGLEGERERSESWLEEAEAQRKLYEQELRQIKKAQRSGDAEERGRRIATCANGCFDLYKHHFAGFPRSSRRPGTLGRVIQRLQELHSELQELIRGGLNSGPHMQNLKVIEGALQRYRAEEKQLRATHESLTLEGQLQAYQDELRAVMERYNDEFAGQNRSDRDLSLLISLCERLFDLCAQLWPFVDREVDEAELIARASADQLRFLHREFEAVRDAQQTPERH